MNKQSKIFVAGHNGLSGSAIVRLLKGKGYENIITEGRKVLDLRDKKKTSDWFEINRPEYVFLAAAKVGGIHANNTYPADFIVDNIQIQTNIIKSSFENNVKKLLSI